MKKKKKLLYWLFGRKRWKKNSDMIARLDCQLMHASFYILRTIFIGFHRYLTQRIPSNSPDAAWNNTKLLITTSIRSQDVVRSSVFVWHAKLLFSNVVHFVEQISVKTLACASDVKGTSDSLQIAFTRPEGRLIEFALKEPPFLKLPSTQVENQFRVATNCGPALFFPLQGWRSYRVSAHE